LNFNEYSFYVCDTETTSLDNREGDIIELSLIRLNDNQQRTWLLKPVNFSGISAEALRVNGHKLEDLNHSTKFGKDTYVDRSKVVAEIENWVMEDGFTSDRRCLIGQNISFDKEYLIQLWKKCGAQDTFPFGRKMIDTMQIVFAMDLASGRNRQHYSLSSLVEDYGVKKEKAHRADADTRMTRDLWFKVFSELQSIFNRSAG